MRGAGEATHLVVCVTCSMTAFCCSIGIRRTNNLETPQAIRHCDVLAPVRDQGKGGFITGTSLTVGGSPKVSTERRNQSLSD
jgi:hypothetical protein